MTTTLCLLGSDLLPWEKAYFRACVDALATQAHVKLHDGDNAELGTLTAEDRLWLIARDWRAALVQLPDHVKSPVFVSVLSLVPTSRGWGLGPASWNPVPRLAVQLWVHSPLALRYYRELESVPELAVMHCALPGFWGESFESDTGFRVGVLSPWTRDANVGFLAAVIHYVHAQKSMARFVLPTQGPLRSHAQQVVSDLGLEDRVCWEDRPDSKMDVLLHSPLQAVHFIPVFWAASRAVPTVSVDLPGVDGWVSDGRSGFIVPVHHTKSVGELLLRLEADAGLRRAMGQNAKASLAARSAVDQWVAQVARALESGSVHSIAGAAA